MRTKICLFAGMVLLSAVSFAQNVLPCATDHVMEAYYANHPGARESYDQEIAMVRSLNATNLQKTGAVDTIPVVVHVFYDLPSDNISDAQIHDAIRVLNEDMRRLNADTSSTRSIFEPVAAGANLYFKLASKDPQGNCTSGINRIYTAMTANGGDNVKALVNPTWPNNRYLNIYVVRTIGISSNVGIVLGYAYLPQSPLQNGTQDGVVIRHDRMGTIGTSTNQGRTLSHEVGHYLGLRHPFSDASGSACGDGDGFSDTPWLSDASFGCSFAEDDCVEPVNPQPNQIENFMDYANDNCMNMFTQQQVNQMEFTVSSSGRRSLLSSASNLLITGIRNPPSCAPVARMEIPKRLVCTGDSVQFFDASEFGATSWQWSFPGGSPSSSTAQNPKVAYSSPGVYDVTLTATNGNGSDTEVLQHSISVRPSQNTLFINWLNEDFENSGGLPNGNWHVQKGVDSVSFRSTSLVGSNSSRSVMLNNNFATANHFDYLISQAIDVASATSLALSFDYAYARRTSTGSDILRVYVSTNCGASWSTAGLLAGPNLITGATTAAKFVPTSTDWKNYTINLDQFAGNPNQILIRWEFKSGGGNNFYMDNINLAATVSTEDNQAFYGVQLFPNPANDQALVQLELMNTQDVAVSLLNIQGQELYQNKRSFESGSQQIALDLNNLPAGIYLVRVATAGKIETLRLIKE